MRQGSDVHQQPVKRQRRNAIRPNSDEARAIEEVAAAYRNDESIVDIRNHIDDISINAPPSSVPLSVFSRIIEDEAKEEEEEVPIDGTDGTPTLYDISEEKSRDSSDDDVEHGQALLGVVNTESKEDGDCDSAPDDTSE